MTVNSKGKPAAHSILGLLGGIDPPVSCLIPVIHSSKLRRIFALGEGPKASFTETEFEELVASGHVLRLSKSCPVGQVAPSMAPEVENVSELPYSVAYYGLYIDTSAPEIASLLSLIKLDSLEKCVVSDTSDRKMWILSSTSLVGLFEKLFVCIERELDNMLVEEFLRRSDKRELVDRNEKVWAKASLLMDFAYDYQSSERAITYGALLRSHDLCRDAKWYFWTRVACKVWKVEDSREHWVERLSAKLDALSLRARRKQLESTLTGFDEIKTNAKVILAAINEMHKPYHSKPFQIWERNEPQTYLQLLGAPSVEPVELLRKSVLEKLVSSEEKDRAGTHAIK